jgi:hypothetical protein
VEERYSLTDQIRRSSRSVCANFAEAWRKRRYQASFIAKLNDCESEAAETQVWLKFAVKLQYIDPLTLMPLLLFFLLFLLQFVHPTLRFLSNLKVSSHFLEILIWNLLNLDLHI